MANFEKREKQEDEPRLKIHTVGPDEWKKLRDIRIRSIQDSPQAFGDTMEQTLARTEEEWQSWTVAKNYVAEVKDRFVAKVTLLKHPDYGDYIVGVWTDPEYRGKGLSKKLFEQLFADAKLAGVDKITLRVNVVQEAAIKSYESLGFKIVDTIAQQKMGDEKFYDEYLMEKEIET